MALLLGKGWKVATILERIRGHYDVQEVEFGRVYRWRPERVVAECGCGAMTILASSASSSTACSLCGTNLSTTAREEPTAEQPDAETLHPWRYEEDREDAGLP